MAVATISTGPGHPPTAFSERGRRVEAAMRRSSVPAGSRLGRMAGYHMGWNDSEGRPSQQPEGAGKLLRGSLCLWAGEAWGGGPDSALPAAAAVEWVHNFTLIHDDIQDGDRRRRHRAAVWAIWGAGQAINAGDGLHALAWRALTADGLHPGRRLNASRALTQAALDVIEGQCLDLALEGRPGITRPTYLRLARAKTGALFGAAIECGAVLAGVQQRLATRVRRAGRDLGTAFQIRDDWLGSFGDPDVTGKPRGSDLARRKLSFVVVAAYSAASVTQRREFRRLFAARDGEGTDRLTALVGELDGSGRVEQVPIELAERAVEALRPCGLDRCALDEFNQLAAYAATRVR